MDESTEEQPIGPERIEPPRIFETRMFEWEEGVPVRLIPREESVQFRFDGPGQQKLRLREWAFWWSLGLVTGTIVLYIITLYLKGWGYLNLSDIALGGFATTVIAQTVSLAVIAFRYLFEEERKKNQK